jgi:hypothetical protein
LVPAAVAEEVGAVAVAVLVPVAEGVVVVAVVVVEVAEEGVVAPASLNRLVRRKAKHLRKNQLESPYPHLAGGRYCGLSIPTHCHL